MPLPSGALLPAIDVAPIGEQEFGANVPEDQREDEVLVLGPDERQERVGDAAGHVLEAAKHFRE